MRYPASEKLEIIRLVEESHLSARQTLAKLGIPRTTFYRWYDRYLQRGEAGLQDQSPKPKHVWNRVPDEVKRKVVDFALQETELSPRELAVTFTDQERYFVSESTVYRMLKAHDLITSPAFIVIKAANEFKDKTIAINQLWQTDFTYINQAEKFRLRLKADNDGAKASMAIAVIGPRPGMVIIRDEASDRAASCFNVASIFMIRDDRSAICSR